jgi:hypothetical protein
MIQNTIFCQCESNLKFWRTDLKAEIQILLQA